MRCLANLQRTIRLFDQPLKAGDRQFILQELRAAKSAAQERKCSGRMHGNGISRIETHYCRGRGSRCSRVATIGFVSAQPGPNGSTPSGDQHGSFNREAFQQRQEQYLNTLAGKLGVSVDKLRQAMADTHKEMGGPGGPGENVVRAAGCQGWALMPPPKLWATRTWGNFSRTCEGKSLAQLAASKNPNATDAVRNALTTTATTRIDQAVTAGRLSTDQANQAKQSLDQRINGLMNRTFPAEGQGFRGEHGPRGPWGSGQ